MQENNKNFNDKKARVKANYREGRRCVYTWTQSDLQLFFFPARELIQLTDKCLLRRSSTVIVGNYNIF